MKVNRSAIIRPLVSASVSRPRIEAMLDAVDAARIVVVQAPAGFGKSHALGWWAEQLAERGRPVFWISARSGLDSADDLLAALTEAARVQGVVLDFADGRPVVEQLLDGTSTWPDPRPVIVVDDTDRLSFAAAAVLAAITQHARDTLTLVLASRGPPAVPVARLRSQERLVEVGPDDLRFSVAEIAQLTVSRLGRMIDIGAAEALFEATAGWAAGVALGIGMLARSGDQVAPLAGYHHHLRAYFDEEVLASARSAVARFLSETAVLRDLDADACNAVTGRSDSAAVLDECVRQGLFIDRVDIPAPVWRLNAMFRDMLLHRLAQEDAPGLARSHRRAAAFFTHRDDPAAAIRHAAEAGDPVFLADLLETCAEAMTYAGGMDIVVAHAEGLSWDLLSTRPMLLLTVAWRKTRRLSYRAAELLIEAAEACLPEASSDPQTPAAMNLRRQVRHRRVMLLAARDDMPAVELEAEALLAEFGDDNAYVSCTLLALLMSARRELYHFQDALKLQAETRVALARPGSDFASIAFKSAIAPNLVSQGKADVAVAFLQEALAKAESMSGIGSGVAALPALPLAEILYDQGDIGRAAELVRAHIGVVREWGFVDHMLAGYLVQARVLVAEGHIRDALAQLAEAHLVALECGLERLRAGVVAEQVRLLLRSGDPATAARLFADAGFTDEPTGPGANVCRRDEVIAITWIRLDIQADRLTRARRLARLWLGFVRRTGAAMSIVRFELLLAEIAVLSGDRSEARRAIRDAISTAAPAGWVRPFLDEGEVITSLLTEAYGDSPRLDGVTDAFAHRLVAMIRSVRVGTIDATLDEGDDPACSGRLARREIQILAMVSGGLRNREIGARLGLTEGTVKWYMQQIYDKLCVRRRPQAVARARQLGMLA